ncbi:MAG TPA: heterodisulfide reductase-related iron-sulfur binding cluster, partial [Chloroflexota bacterium]|nr:heterodisulfide reductase-related iron-sulfur binding cluster [Chloroflexota bacterium]
MRKTRFAVGLAAGVAFGVATGRRAGDMRRVLNGGNGKEVALRLGRHGNGHEAKAHHAMPKLEFPDRELLRQCVHCGLCLPFCPTYRALSLEGDSPRGRIFQMKLVADGEVSPNDPHFRKHIFQCLDCRACETACPSGVQYGRLIEAARSIVPAEGGAERAARGMVLGAALNSRAMLAVVGTGARAYQRSGLQAMVRGTGLLKPVAVLKRMEAMLPSLQGRLLAKQVPAYVPAQGEARHRVALLSGCIASQFFPETNLSTAAVLSANGCDVFAPPEQGCCGALQNHSGDRKTALKMARHNIDVFESVHPDFIVVNSAGCGSMMKEYGDLLRDDSQYAERAKQFSAK